MSAGGVSPSAVLGREVVELGEERFAGYLAGARVLVTGAGGSLGRALARRLTGIGVETLVLVDQGEAALAEAHDELGHLDPGVRVVAVLADLRSASRSRALLAEHAPEAVFHAAAYKVVPLVEASPLEAVATNVLATEALVDASLEAGVARFVLFTTDKAVRPVSVLGRTKAAAECIVGTAARRADLARFACIRLGNVVDSAGSMLPLVRRRLAADRPVPITDARVTRYLMTADEAVALAVAAGGLAGSGEVFRLDMGPPVRVLDAARTVAEASANGHGATIELVGLRPGEKLHEELDEPGEPVERVGREPIFRSAARYADADWLAGRLDGLRAAVTEADALAARRELARLVAGIRIADRLPEPVGPV